MKACAEAPATHYRLAEETWDLIVEEYAAGASAKDLAAKWKTSAGSVYRHARLRQAGKRAVGDARARAHARMVEEEEAATRALHPAGSRALKGLFAAEPQDRPEASDPGELRRLATLAAGRAMTGRLWAEAKALAALAESFSRLEARADAGALPLDNAPLWLIAEAAADPEAIPCRRLNYVHVPDKERRADNPDEQARRYFWERRRAFQIRHEDALKAEYWNGRKHGREEAERERNGG